MARYGACALLLLLFDGGGISMRHVAIRIIVPRLPRCVIICHQPFRPVDVGCGGWNTANHELLTESRDISRAPADRHPSPWVSELSVCVQGVRLNIEVHGIHRFHEKHALKCWNSRWNWSRNPFVANTKPTLNIEMDFASIFNLDFDIYVVHFDV